LRSLIPIIVDPKVPLEAKIKELLPYVNNLITKKDTLLKSALQEVGSKLVLSYPNDAKAHALFGDILISSGNLKGAILQFEKTIALDDKKYLVWSQLLYALYDDNDFTKLKKFADQAIDLFPNEAESFFFAAMADIHFNKPNSSFSLAEEAIMISGSDKDKSALSFTAKAASLLALGETDKAEFEITKALEYSEYKNAFAYEIQGDIFIKNKNFTGAKQAYASSLKRGNQSKRLEKKINEQAN
jgi:tetratricopeptide (TPR) repeat protein